MPLLSLFNPFEAGTAAPSAYGLSRDLSRSPEDEVAPGALGPGTAAAAKGS